MAAYRINRRKESKLNNLYPPVSRSAGKTKFDIYNYDMLFNDGETRKLIREGRTIGCFYIESPGMRSLLQRLDCDTFEMLTAASSVIRPGVAESGMMQEFIARHKDPDRRKYLVPEMETYLGETYGVMIYQEDVIKVVHHIAGMTLEEADLLRRAMSGKMRSHEAMRGLAGRFYESCKAKGFSPGVTKQLWRQIESFAGYAFCKAHSASFAILSFQVAYLKVHYPAEFMASVLGNHGGYYSSAVYINECKRMGLKVLLPSINHSNSEYEGSGDTIQIGLLAIKEIQTHTVEKIIEERKTNGRYVSLIDFLVRTKTSYEQTELLIKCGAMDCLDKTRPTLMRLIDIYFRQKEKWDESYNNLFFNESLQLEKEVETKQQYGIEKICTIEYELLGYMVTKHPLEFFRGITDSPNIVRAIDLQNNSGKKIKMIGWFMASKRIKTRKGNIMKFLSLEDLSGTFEAVIFPETYAKYAELTLSMGPYLIEGKADTENGNNIIVEKMIVLSAAEIKSLNQKDSTGNKYFGDVEKISEEEFTLVKSLGKEKLRRAYL